MQSKYTDHIEFQTKTIFMVAADLGRCYGILIERSSYYLQYNISINTLGNCVCYLVFLYNLMHLKVADIETNLSRVDLFRIYYENRKCGFIVI